MAAPGKMTRHDMKHDELVSAVEQAGGFLLKNPAMARNGGIALAAAAVLIVGGYMVMQSRASSARRLLAEAESRFAGSIASEGTRPGAAGPVYGNESERDRAALEKFSQLVNSYGGRKEGRIGAYYQGVLLARLGRHKEAQDALSRFLASPSSPLLAGLAKAQLAQAQAAQGDLDGAAKAYSELAEEKDAAYPRDWALLYLAQTLDQQNKHAEAMAAVEKIKKEYPGSPVQGEVERFFGPVS